MSINKKTPVYCWSWSYQQTCTKHSLGLRDARWQGDGHSSVCVCWAEGRGLPGLPVVPGLGSRNTNGWQLRPGALAERDRVRMSTKEGLRDQMRGGWGGKEGEIREGPNDKRELCSIFDFLSVFSYQCFSFCWGALIHYCVQSCPAEWDTTVRRYLPLDRDHGCSSSPENSTKKQIYGIKLDTRLSNHSESRCYQGYLVKLCLHRHIVSWVWFFFFRFVVIYLDTRKN